MIIFQSINSCIDGLDGLKKDSINGVSDGVRHIISVTTRGDTERFKGEYAQVIEGINKILDSIVKPINDATFVLEQIAEGHLNVKMEGDYKGVICFDC